MSENDSCRHPGILGSVQAGSINGSGIKGRDSDRLLLLIIN